MKPSPDLLPHQLMLQSLYCIGSCAHNAHGSAGMYFRDSMLAVLRQGIFSWIHWPDLQNSMPGIGRQGHDSLLPSRYVALWPELARSKFLNFEQSHQGTAILKVEVPIWPWRPFANQTISDSYFASGYQPVSSWLAKFRSRLVYKVWSRKKQRWQPWLVGMLLGLYRSWIAMPPFFGGHHILSNLYSVLVFIDATIIFCALLNSTSYMNIFSSLDWTFLILLDQASSLICNARHNILQT